MLHELVHNVQGPHNAVFYKLLDEITEVNIDFTHTNVKLAMHGAATTQQPRWSTVQACL